MRAETNLIDKVTRQLEEQGFTFLKSANRFRRKNGKNTDSIRIIVDGGKRFFAQYWSWNQRVEELFAEIRGISLNEATAWTIRSLPENDKKSWTLPGSELPSDFVLHLNNTIMPWFERQTELASLRQLLEEREFKRDEWLRVLVIDKMLNDIEHAKNFRIRIISWLSTANLTSQSLGQEAYKKFSDKFPEFFVSLPILDQNDDADKRKEDADFQLACEKSFATQFPLNAERLYVFLFLGLSTSPFWNWKNWENIFPIFDPLLATCRGKAQIQTIQTRNGKAISLGALNWSPTSHQKWTHNSPGSLPNVNDAQFLSLTVFAPSLKQCESEKFPPDLILYFQNESLSDEKQEFDSTVIVAFRESYWRNHSLSIAPALQEISKKFNSKLVAKIERPFLFSGNQFHSLIDLPLGIFRPGRAKQVLGAKLQALLGPWAEVQSFEPNSII